jgi:hypothetical protein
MPGLLAYTYQARGIWTVRVVDLVLQDGEKMTSRTLELDLRISELPVIPLQGDQISVIADDQFLPFGAVYGQAINLQVDDVRLDSGGACKCILKRVM